MRPILALAGAVAWASALHALTPNEWRFSQTVDVTTAGLIRLNLPPETLNAARPGLEDLRVLDKDGNELPHLVDRSMPQRESALRPIELRTALESAATRITLKTGTTSSINGVTLETTAEFIKAADVEGSHNGKEWKRLATNQPIFRTSGAVNLRVSFPERVWEFLRLTIDDSRAPAVPITGIQLHVAESTAPVEPVAATIKSSDETLGLTRLAVDLGASNLTIASLRIEASDPLFTRAVRIGVPELADQAIREQVIATGSIYRVELNEKTEARLDIPIDAQIRGRNLIVLIENGDSPPLTITNLRCDRRIARLAFLAREPGQYRLLSGNSQCQAPRYDLSGLSDRLKNAVAAGLRPASLVENLDYKAPDSLTGVSLTGAKIDIRAWKSRRALQISTPGWQQVELDPDLLARAASDLRDLRIVREDRQVPFLIERTSISRALLLTATAANDPKRPTLSRWSLKLPVAGVPITRISCMAGTALFQREMRLREETADERGDKYSRELGQANWRQVPDHASRDLAIQLNTPPRTDTLFLETDNGDNPAIELHGFRGFYPVTRVVFTTGAETTVPMSIYCGNPHATSPRYDVSLIADQLFRAEHTAATLGSPEETDSPGGLAQTFTGSARYIFWGVLALVVVTLLLLVARLLPADNSSEK